ncbi:MAG: hypothetical protein ACO1SV_18310 [Fimbriimonas sp.]
MLIALVTLATTSQLPDSRASQVVAESVAAYRRLKSYFDRGTVAEYVTARGRREAAWPRTEFQTWYERPARLRLQAFEIDRGRRQGTCVLWPSRGSYRLWSTWGGVQSGRLAETLAATPARVGEFVETVLCQVDAKASGIDPLLPLVDGQYLGVQKVDGWPCDVVRGESDRIADVTLWIDQRSRLLRQVRTPVEGGRELIVSLKPLANPTFAPGTFDFVPPKRRS